MATFGEIANDSQLEFIGKWATHKGRYNNALYNKLCDVLLPAKPEPKKTKKKEAVKEVA